MKKSAGLFICALLLSVPFSLSASDSSDAEALRKKCEREIKGLEIAAMNFGDAKDKGDYVDGAAMIRKGRVELSQSKYKEAIETYNAYIKLQNEIYASLAAKYLDRTKSVNDAIASEMADSIDTPKVSDYLKLAYRNFEDAKTAMSRGYPVQVIDACRRSKKYSIGTYGLVKKPVPPSYAVDLADADGKIGQPSK